MKEPDDRLRKGSGFAGVFSQRRIDPIAITDVPLEAESGRVTLTKLRPDDFQFQRSYRHPCRSVRPSPGRSPMMFTATSWSGPELGWRGAEIQRTVAALRGAGTNPYLVESHPKMTGRIVG